jgi:hypothetical protein
MRFMVLVDNTEAGVPPDKTQIVEIGKFNEELVKAGVLLAVDGLHKSAKGARLKFPAESKPIVTDGPFTESKELICGFWIIQVKSKEEAIEWFKRCPAWCGEREIRQVMDAADFADMIDSAEGRAILGDQSFSVQKRA